MIESRTIKGVALLCAGNLAFCTMVCLVGYVAEFNSYTTTMFRFLIGIALLSTLAVAGKIKLEFVAKRTLFLRGLFGGVAIIFAFSSITHLGVIKGSVVLYAYPIFAALFSGLFLKERISILKWCAIAAAFAGLIMIITRGDGSRGLLGIGKYEILAIVGAVSGGIAVVLVKKLHATDNSSSIYFSQCIVGLWLVLIPAFSSQSPMVMGMKTGVIVLIIGILAAIGQLVFTEGYRYISVATGALFIMTAPVLNVTAGVLFFNESLTVSMIIGAGIVLGACAVIIRET
ncbi:MAG: EamA family transporter [Chitinivibrionales bacterium]|nr:EamA family transporter [Chitinivibrionales bacterium]